MFIIVVLPFTGVASSGSGSSRVTVPGGTSGGVGDATKFFAIYVGVGVSVHMSHTRFGLRATTVGEGGVMGSTRIRARAVQIVDGSEGSTTDVLGEALNGLKGTSGQRVTRTRSDLRIRREVKTELT